MTATLAPEVLPPPIQVERDHSADVALALAAAFLVVRSLASAWLAAQEPDHSGRLARVAWSLQQPVWLKLAVPSLARAYAQGGLTPDQATRAATAYAAALGEHLGETSGEALIQGFEGQLATRWPERTAWQRASSAYGLDGPRMFAWVKSLLGSERIPSQRRVDDLLMARAMLLGETEAWRARNSGRVLGWVWMEQNGLLEAGTMKMWRTARDELTCPFCRELDGQTVPVAEPFVYPDGTEIFCPPAHPRCRCEPDLTHPPLEDLGKAWTPEESAKHPHETSGQGRGRFARTAADAEPVAEEVASPYAELPPSSPYAPTSPYASTSPYARAASPYADTSSPYAAASPYSQATQGSPYAQSPYREQPKQAMRRILMVVPRPRPKRGELPAANRPMYIVARTELQNSVLLNIDHLLPTRSGNGIVLNFDRVIANGNFKEKDLERMGMSGVAPLDVIQEKDLGYEVPRATRSELNAGDPSDFGIPDPSPEEAEFWTNNRAWPVRVEAEHMVRDITAKLSFADLNEIFQLADFDGADQGYGNYGDEPRTFQNVLPERDKRTILAGVFEPGRTPGDIQLANAYMDYIAYVKPDLAGDKGQELYRAMQVAGSPDRSKVGMVRFNHPPVADVYVFANGFHPDNKGEMLDPQGKEFKLVSGKYKVHSIHYEPVDTRPGLAAVRWIYLQPLVD